MGRKIHTQYVYTSRPNRVTVASRSTEIWPVTWISWNIDIRRSLNCRAKVAEEIDLEICTYRQLSDVQMVRDLGWGQGHTSIHSTCSTSSLPNHVTVASRTTEIWSFEFREIWTLDEVWTLVIGFLEGNSKIGFQQAVAQVSYYHHQPSVLSSMPKRRRW